MQQSVSKTDLRKQLRMRRYQISSETRSKAVRDMLCVVRRQRFIAAGRRIALYWPFDGELDCAPIIAYAWSMQAQVMLPVVSPLRRLRLGFAPYTPGTRLTLDQYGIPTPVTRSGSMVTVHELDLIFLPLVGFDRSGSRLGMGAGHYDATVAFLRRRHVWRQPRLIGVGYSFQEVENLPRDPWDLVLHGVVTDSEYIEFKP